MATAKPLKGDGTNGLPVEMATTDRLPVGNLPTGYTAVADAAYQVLATDRFVAYTSITAARIVTLCAANAVDAGTHMVVADMSGSCQGPAAGTSKEIQVKPTGTDTVEGIAAATNFEVIRDAYGSVELASDGVSNWTIVSVIPAVRVELFGSTVAGGYRKPLTLRAAKIEVQAAGGGGGSGARNVSGANAAGGSSGAPGGFTELLVLAADLSATETPTVGAAGTGATAQASNAASKVGGNGGDASFTVGGAVGLYAQGGRGGPVGASSTTSGGTAAAAVAQYPAAVGAQGADVVTPAAIGGGSGQNWPVAQPGAGGGGGGYVSSVAIDGAAGGAAAAGFGAAGVGAAAGAAGTGGGSGGAGGAFSTVTGTNQFGPGAGGGGGAGRLNAAAGAGGNGGKYGAGGGGGGGGSGGNGGAGGTGGVGGILVTSYR